MFFDELSELNSMLINSVKDNDNLISAHISRFLSLKSKRLRSLLIFLFAKSLNFDVTDKIYNLACAVELIHNATLIHDDILDNAPLRRGEISLNSKLGTNLSILAGDILVSLALSRLAKCENSLIINNFADCIYNMCKGEINQNFSINKLPSMEEYVKKSEYKTAELFKAGLNSLAQIQNISQKNEIISFSLNFGIAFQMKDDLLNILNYDKSKPELSDINTGIYTAPVIYLNEDINIKNLSKEEIILHVKNKKYIAKTVNLIENYAKQAIKSIEFMPNNKYKNEIVKITEDLYKAGINE